MLAMNVEIAIEGSERNGPILDPDYLTFLTLINIFQTGVA